MLGYVIAVVSQHCLDERFVFSALRRVLIELDRLELAVLPSNILDCFVNRVAYALSVTNPHLDGLLLLTTTM